MKIDVYRLTCLTNLHMGSGDVNYSIIDQEVERDPVLGEPTMNATGVKGALRDYFEDKKMDKEVINRIFGTKAEKGIETTPGTYKFFNADLLARPVRVSEGSCSYVMAASWDMLENLTRKLKAFRVEGCLPDYDLKKQDGIVGGGDVSGVEGNPVSQKNKANDFMKKLLGTDNWVVMNGKALSEISLPVQAHNVLENGKSQNLWYEELVPHESVFLLMIAYPGEKSELELDGKVVQFGANASTGCGYVEMKKLPIGGN